MHSYLLQRLRKSLITTIGFSISFGLLAHSATANPTRATERIRLPVPQLSTVARLPRFGEGVVFDSEGRLFVSDAFNNAILTVSETGETEVWANVSLPNGHKVLADGTHVVMEQQESSGAVVFLDSNGQVLHRIHTDDQKRPLRAPNDIAVDLQNGGFYFTDPGPFMADAPGRIFYVTPDRQICTVSDGELDFPNGIVLRPDGESLLVAESLQNRVVEFQVQFPCQLSSARVFASLPSQPNAWTNGEAEPDGMALDRTGNLYVAHFGAGLVRVFNPSGELLGSLGTGSTSVTNLAFGGPEYSELYVYGANGNSFEELDRGGRIIRLTLPGIQGLTLN